MAQQPILRYVGVLDTSNASSGVAEFKIIFDSSINALMFEYKYQPVGDDIVTPTDFISGFIYPDAVEPAQIEIGSTSAYVLPLPVPVDCGCIEYNVSVRIYTVNGFSSGGTSYTPWSNSLLLIRPPVQPIITQAFYDAGDYYYTDTYIYVNLDPSFVDLTDFSVKYIASYYYVKRTETTTTWETTALLSLDASGGVQLPRLTILAKGDVSTTYPEIYIAINKVLPFANNLITYYSLSEISNTFTATQAEISAPTMDSVTYVENNVADQSMIVVWSPPSSAFIPSFAVDYYTLEVNIHGIGTPLNPLNWTPIGGQIPPSGPGAQTYTYNIDVSNNPQGFRFDFRVDARLVSGTETDWSNVLGANQVDINPPSLSPLTYLEYNDNPLLREQKMVLNWTPAYNSKQQLPSGFTASSYEIYLGVDEANPTLLTTVGNVLTYTYDIVDPLYLASKTNLNFYVKAVITQTGGLTSITTDASNEENLNTYTYATRPQNLNVDWVINDPDVSGNVDVAFTWENVLNPGLGFQQDASACQYYWKVYATNDPSGVAVVSGTVPYNPAQIGNKYNVSTTYTAVIGNTYRIEVYLQTPDTNYLHALRNGLSARSNDLVPVSVPFIYDVVVHGDFKVSFKILSSTIVAPQAVFVYGVPGIAETVTSFTTAGIPYVVDGQGNYNYTISTAITPVILPSNYLGFAIMASNSAGIGFHEENRV
jgi:hypothetical protein